MVQDKSITFLVLILREFYDPIHEIFTSLVYYLIITGGPGKASFEFFNAASLGVRVVVEVIDGYGNIGWQVYRYKVE